MSNHARGLQTWNWTNRRPFLPCARQATWWKCVMTRFEARLLLPLNVWLVPMQHFHIASMILKMCFICQASQWATWQSNQIKWSWRLPQTSNKRRGVGTCMSPQLQTWNTCDVCGMHPCLKNCSGGLTKISWSSYPFSWKLWQNIRSSSPVLAFSLGTELASSTLNNLKILNFPPLLHLQAWVDGSALVRPGSSSDCLKHSVSLLVLLSGFMKLASMSRPKKINNHERSCSKEHREPVWTTAACVPVGLPVHKANKDADHCRKSCLPHHACVW